MTGFCRQAKYQRAVLNFKAALLRSVIIFNDFRLKFSGFALFNNFLRNFPTFPYCRVSVAPVEPCIYAQH